MTKSSLFSTFVSISTIDKVLDGQGKTHISWKQGSTKPNINDDYPYTEYIANNQSLNQGVIGNRGLVTELRHLRGPSIQIEIEGNELMLTANHKSFCKRQNASYLRYVSKHLNKRQS